MSFFSGGTRTAEVVAKTEAVAAMLTFDELELLKQHSPVIRLKLMVLFAAEGIKKLRGTNNNGNNNAHGQPVSSAASTRRPSREEIPLARRSGGGQFLLDNDAIDPNKLSASPYPGRSQNNSRRTSMERMGSPQLGGMERDEIKEKKKEGEKEKKVSQRGEEALFRLRMAVEERKQQEELHKQLEKRKEAEHKMANLNVLSNIYQREINTKNAIIESLQLEKSKLQEWKARTLQERVTEERYIKSLTESNENLLLQMHDLQTANAELQATVGAMQEIINKREQKKEMEIKVIQHHVDLEKTRLEGKVAEREAQIRELESKLSQAHQETKQIHHTKLDTMKSYDEKIEVLKTEHALELTTYQSTIQQASHQLTLTQQQLQTYEEELDTLRNWKHEMMAANYHNEFITQNLTNRLSKTLLSHSNIHSSLSSYKVLLKYSLVATYVKQYRIRKYMYDLTAQFIQWIYEMEQVIQKDVRYDINRLISSNEAAYGVYQRLSQEILGNKKKKNHIHTVPPFSESLSTLSTLTPIVTAFVQELNNQCTYWHQTADAFFTRTVELKQNVMYLEEENRVYEKQKEVPKEEKKTPNFQIPLAGDCERHTIVNPPANKALLEELESVTIAKNQKVNKILENKQVTHLKKTIKSVREQNQVLTGKVLLLTEKLRQVEAHNASRSAHNAHMLYSSHMASQAMLPMPPVHTMPIVLNGEIMVPGHLDVSSSAQTDTNGPSMTHSREPSASQIAFPPVFSPSRTPKDTGSTLHSTLASPFLTPKESPLHSRRPSWSSINALADTVNSNATHGTHPNNNTNTNSTSPTKEPTSKDTTTTTDTAPRTPASHSRRPTRTNVETFLVPPVVSTTHTPQTLSHSASRSASPANRPMTSPVTTTASNPPSLSPSPNATVQTTSSYAYPSISSSPSPTASSHTLLPITPPPRDTTSIPSAGSTSIFVRRHGAPVASTTSSTSHMLPPSASASLNRSISSNTNGTGNTFHITNNTNLSFPFNPLLFDDEEMVIGSTRTTSSPLPDPYGLHVFTPYTSHASIPSITSPIRYKSPAPPSSQSVKVPHPHDERVISNSSSLVQLPALTVPIPKRVL